MTPSSYGLITYTALGGEPVRGYAHYPFNFGGLPSGSTYAAGDTVVVALDYGYDKLDKKIKVNNHSNITIGGLSETLNFGSITSWDMEFSTISDIRGLGLTEEIAAFEAMQLAGVSGQTLRWYPDYTANPTIYYDCALRKRVPPTRMGEDIHLWRLSMTLEVLPTVTIPSVPVFV